MNGTDIALTIIGVLGTLSSILFAFLAFKRNDKKDTKEETTLSPSLIALTNNGQYWLCGIAAARNPGFIRFKVLGFFLKNSETVFANSVVSPAMEFQSEGRILGTGANMFKIAGPVIVYGSAAAVIYGIVYYIFWDDSFLFLWGRFLVLQQKMTKIDFKSCYIMRSRLI